MKTKSAVTKRFALLYAVLLTLSLGHVGLSFGRPAAQAIESGGSGAYYLTEDRTTRGLWYNGENGSLDNPDADRTATVRCSFTIGCAKTASRSKTSVS